MCHTNSMGQCIIAIANYLPINALTQFLEYTKLSINGSCYYYNAILSLSLILSFINIVSTLSSVLTSIII